MNVISELFVDVTRVLFYLAARLTTVSLEHSSRVRSALLSRATH